MDGSISRSWELLLVAYLSGDCDFTTMYSAARKPLVRIVGRLAPLLSEDLREDVVQQLFIRLIENPPTYDLDLCSPRALTYGLIRNAVRQVRAMFAPPGQKTRISKNEKELGSQNADLTTEHPTAEKKSIPGEVEQAPSPRWTAAGIHAFAQTSDLLARLPQDEGTAAWLVYGLEYSITEAASIMNKSRFAVARSLKQSLHSARPETHPPRQLAALSISVAA